VEKSLSKAAGAGARRNADGSGPQGRFQADCQIGGAAQQLPAWRADRQVWQADVRMARGQPSAYSPFEHGQDLVVQFRDIAWQAFAAAAGEHRLATAERAGCHQAGAGWRRWLPITIPDPLRRLQTAATDAPVLGCWCSWNCSCERRATRLA
jgi:hypothetical protein